MDSDATDQVAAWLQSSLGWEGAEFVSALSGGNSNLTWQFRDGARACVVRTQHIDDNTPTAARGHQREAQTSQAIENK